MPIYACTLIKARPQRTAQVEYDTAKIPEVGMLFPTTGRADFVALIRAEDTAALGNVLLRHFQPNKVIAHVTTLVFIGEIVSMAWAQCAKNSPVVACVLVDITVGNIIRAGQGIGELDEVVFVAPAAGEVDIVAMVKAPSPVALGSIVSRLQSIEGVRKTEMLIALGDLMLHRWGLELGTGCP